MPIDSDDEGWTPLKYSIPEFSPHPNEERVGTEEDGNHGMRPILRFILGKPVKLPSDPFRRLTYKELEEAACRRKIDFEDVVRILKSPNTIKALDPSWMYDFVNTEGNNVNSLAKLLVDEKYDSPWILRPDYFANLSSTFTRVKLGDFTHSTHVVSEYVPNNEVGFEDSKSECSVDEKPMLRPDLMLGLAGFIPVGRAGLNQDLLHESWLEDVQRHMAFGRDEPPTVSVTYGKRCLPGSLSEAYILARQTQASLAVLIQYVQQFLQDLNVL